MRRPTPTKNRGFFGVSHVEPRIWVGGGFFGAALAAVGLTLPALLLVAPMAIVPTVYSFVRSKQLERLGQL